MRKEPQETCRNGIEWPTVTVAALIYGGWAAVTLLHARLPIWLLVPSGAWLVAWHASLQHEIIHGHPTRRPGVNRLLGSIPLSLWLPLERYRVTHLEHHRDELLTDPLGDPESAYLAADQWQRLHPLSRAVVRAQTTLLGRLLIGPAWRVSHFLWAEARAVAAGDRARRHEWAEHLVGVALVVLWLKAVCGMSAWLYLAAIVYPGTSLILLRSFAEHRAAAGVSERTAIVENARILGPLFLFNNLHAAHHENPSKPWYELPRWYRENRPRLVALNGGLVYDNYFEITRRFLLKPHDEPAHPLGHAPVPAKARA